MPVVMSTTVVQMLVCNYHFFQPNEPELFGEIANSRPEAEKVQNEPGIS